MVESAIKEHHTMISTSMIVKLQNGLKLNTKEELPLNQEVVTHLWF
jgi:hypothetical protein